MTRQEALERVAEAAERVFDRLNLTPSTPPELHILRAVLDEARALPPEPEGQAVEVAVWLDPDDGEVVFCIPKTERDEPLQGWTRLGTTTLRVRGDGA